MGEYFRVFESFCDIADVGKKDNCKIWQNKKMQKENKWKAR